MDREREKTLPAIQITMCGMYLLQNRPFYRFIVNPLSKEDVHMYTTSLSNVPSDGLADNTFKLLSPKVNKLHSFLLNHNYVITMTDKNLGLAVSEQTWILDNTWACLSNQRDYKLLNSIKTRIVLDRKCNEMLLLSQQAENYDWKYDSLSEYL
jgi:hypothetical protein